MTKISETREYDKYFVIKKESLKKLTTYERRVFDNLIGCLTSENEYWVVNKDEPYADQVRDLIFGVSLAAGWIPVSEKLPEDDGCVLVNRGNYEDDDGVDLGFYVGPHWLLLGGAVYKVKEVSNRAGRKSKKKKESE